MTDTKNAFDGVFGVNQYLYPGGEFKVIESPKYTWKWTLNSFDCFQVNSVTGPNWFHRWAQRLILGIIWEKL